MFSVVHPTINSSTNADKSRTRFMIFYSINGHHCSLLSSKLCHFKESPVCRGNLLKITTPGCSGRRRIRCRRELGLYSFFFLCVCVYLMRGEMEEREGRSLSETPTWAFATVITALVCVGFLIHGGLKKCGKVRHASSS